YHEGRERLQKALDRDQARMRAASIAVLPITLDQLLASERDPAGLSQEAMRRIWKTLHRRMAADTESRGAVARVLRALLDPRVSHVLAAAAGAFATYLLMKSPPAPRRDAAAEVRMLASRPPALPLGPEAPEQGTGASGAPELQADTAVADAGQSARTTA